MRDKVGNLPKKVERKFAYFAAVGCLGFAVDSFTTLTLNISSPETVLQNRTIGYLIAASFAWWMNRNLTFSDISHETPHAIEWLRYVVLNLCGAAVNIAVYRMTTLFFDSNAQPSHAMIGIAFGSFAGMFINYYINTNFIFRKSYKGA